MTEKSLIVAEKLDPVALYTEGGMKKILIEIETKVKAFTPDVSTEESRKEVVSFAYKITRSKTLLDNIGKEMVADWKAKSGKVDAVRKAARDFCDDLKAGVRKPLDEWEAEEAKRKEEEERKEREKVEARMADLAKYDTILPYFDIAAMGTDEYHGLFAKVKSDYEAEQARIAEEKRLEAERIAKEEADRKAESERIAKERAVLEAEKNRLAEDQRKIDEANRKIKEDQEAAQRKIDDERAAIEAEKHKEQARIEKEAFEKQAKIDAEKEAAAKVEREEKERVEKEEAAKVEAARQEALRPEKEQVLAFLGMVHKLLTERPVKLKDRKVQFVCNIFADVVWGQIDKATTDLEAL